jgi:hypothetical protein
VHFRIRGVKPAILRQKRDALALRVMGGKIMPVDQTRDNALRACLTTLSGIDG